jgi:hypothetical protein
MSSLKVQEQLLSIAANEITRFMSLSPLQPSGEVLTVTLTSSEGIFIGKFKAPPGSILDFINKGLVGFKEVRELFGNGIIDEEALSLSAIFRKGSISLDRSKAKR